LAKLADKTGVDKTDLAKLADKTGCQNWQADKTDAVETNKADLEEVLTYIRAVGTTTRQDLIEAYEGIYSARTLDRYVKRLASEGLIREVHDRSNKNRVSYEPTGSF